MGHNKDIRRKKKFDRDVMIAKRAVDGATNAQISREFDISSGRVSQILNREDIKDIVDRAHARLVSHTLPTAVENIHHAVLQYQTTKDKTEKDHGFRASEKVLESAGLLAGNSTSIVHQTYIETQTNVMSPVIEKLLQKHFQGFILDKPVWEIEEKKENAVETGEIEKDNRK